MSEKLHGGMPSPIPMPYGWWESPITGQEVSTASGGDGGNNQNAGNAALRSVLTPEFWTPGALKKGSAGVRYYPPTNPAYAALSGEVPPMVIDCGTPSADQAVDSENIVDVSYWTSRGFAVLAVPAGSLKEDEAVPGWLSAVVDRLIEKQKADAARLVLRATPTALDSDVAIAEIASRCCAAAFDMRCGICDELLVRSLTERIRRVPLFTAFSQDVENGDATPCIDEFRKRCEREGQGRPFVAVCADQSGYDCSAQQPLIRTEHAFFAAFLRLPVFAAVQPPDIEHFGDEWFEIVDAEGDVIGVALRSLCHGNPSLVHRTVHVAVFSSGGDLLLQKRTQTKDIQPGKWDTAVGGHLAAGESEACGVRREAYEELGVDVVEGPEYLFDMRIRNRIESENVKVYRMTHDGPFHPPAEEIAALEFWSPQRLRETSGSGLFTPSLEKELSLLVEAGQLPG